MTEPTMTAEPMPVVAPWDQPRDSGGVHTLGSHSILTAFDTGVLERSRLVRELVGAEDAAAHQERSAITDLLVDWPMDDLPIPEDVDYDDQDPFYKGYSTAIRDIRMVLLHRSKA